MKTRLLYIVSDIDKALAFEWIANHLPVRFDMAFLLIGKSDTALIKYLSNKGIRHYVIGDKPGDNFFLKWLKVLRIIRKEKPHIVHTHLWRANILGQSAAWILRIRKRIFTRHHAMVHYDEYPSGRKWDVLCNAMATHIVAISQNVRNILIHKDKANPAKIHVINHGFDLKYFEELSPGHIEEMAGRYDFHEGKKPIIGVISRYLRLKGIQYIIPAFAVIREKYPTAHLVLANAIGDYSKEIKDILQTLPPSSYTEIQFENDLATLYGFFDVFIHTPIDENSEAFGQTYVEALSAKVPSVFTLSGIAPEFIKHGHNALVVGYKNPEEIAAAILRLLEDETLRDWLKKEGKDSVARFSLNEMLIKLENLYE
jgi:glycosyltransferase involved in cell wall biosynthesis